MSYWPVQWPGTLVENALMLASLFYPIKRHRLCLSSKSYKLFSFQPLLTRDRYSARSCDAALGASNCGRADASGPATQSFAAGLKRAVGLM